MKLTALRHCAVKTEVLIAKYYTPQTLLPRCARWRAAVCFPQTGALFTKTSKLFGEA